MQYFVVIPVFLLSCIMLQSHGSPAETSVPRRRIPRIVHGEPSYISIYPSQIELYYDGDFYCGGTIISKEWVVTAAHCVDKGTAKDFHVYCGSSYLNKDMKHKVINLTLHKKYDMKKIIYDIAVVKVLPEFEYNANVQPAALPEAGIELAKQTTVRVVGHGLTDDGRISNVLREESMFVCNYEECKSAYKDIFNISESHLCVCYGQEVKGFCSGDSGGPGLLKNDTLVGVVSCTNLPCGRKDYPQVMANVPYLRDWIKEKTGI